MDHPEQTEGTRRIEEIEQRRKRINTAFDEHQDNFTTVQHQLDDAELRYAVSLSAATGWQDAVETSQPNTTPELSHAVEVAHLIYQVAAGQMINVSDSNVKSVLGPTATYFLNSHVAGREDDAPQVVRTSLRDRFSAALRNNGFFVTNQGSPEHPDFEVKQRKTP